MAEDPRDDRQFLALFEAQRRAGVAQVMETLARESGRRQRRLETVQHVRCVERSPERGGEDVALVDPPATGYEPFGDLAPRCSRRAAASSEPRRNVRRERSVFGSASSPVLTLRVCRTVRVPSSRFHVVPAEPEEFALPEPEADRDHVERSEAVIGDAAEEDPNLFQRQRPTLGRGSARRADLQRDVASHALGPERIAQRDPQDRERIPDRRGRKVAPCGQARDHPGDIMPPERTPREPWDRERDDAAYREALRESRPVKDGPDTILADMERDIEAAIVRARGRLSRS